MVVHVPIESALPKYAAIVNAVQARIGDGTYPPGSMLPSETDLMNEFKVSRPTVVRAFEYLRQHEWIDTQQGKGRFARTKPADPRGLPPHAAAFLTDEAEGRVRILDAGQVAAPTRAASALDVGEGDPVVVRRRLISVDGLGPVELGTAYVPVDLAQGTDVTSPVPLVGGLLRHLADRKGVAFDHATERISARAATAEESRLLEIGRRECVLTALLTVRDRSGAALVALDVVLPPTRHELEDSFPVTY
jgi:GntR family transcriptional regulator